MNNFWNFKKELKIILLAFLVVLSLPLIAIIILTQTGINLVSDKLEKDTSLIQNAPGSLVPVCSVCFVHPLASCYPVIG